MEILPKIKNKIKTRTIFFILFIITNALFIISSITLILFSLSKLKIKNINLILATMSICFFVFSLLFGIIYDKNNAYVSHIFNSYLFFSKKAMKFAYESFCLNMLSYMPKIDEYAKQKSAKFFNKNINEQCLKLINLFYNQNNPIVTIKSSNEEIIQTLKKYEFLLDDNTINKTDLKIVFDKNH
ncbi:hypothetical protein [Metamycoplasma buccale]|uniref:hypothetical protein n=1 Tax=Metamycoplasma buccale TaxID=55602 RepID=UPI00398E3A76